MRYLLTTVLVALSLPPVTIHAQPESNIVITDAIENYTLVPDKSGNGIAEIKQTRTYSYEATRVPGVAIDYVFYDSFTHVKKATVKAKGVKPVYQSAISAGIFYDDSKVCSVTVPLEEVGKPVKTHFELTRTRPDMEPVVFLAERYPIHNGSVTISMPIAFKDRYDIATSNLGDNVIIERGPSDNNRDWTITVSYHDMPELNTPDDAPPSRYILPTIQLIGHFANPQELYSTLHSYTTEPDPDPESVRAKALEITAGCDSDADRARAIYNWVNANIRYVAIEHGDLGHRPDHASAVLAKLYGDCKGSANLIKSMLNAAGLDGRLVWIGTERVPYDFTDIPAYSSGNHMIAALKLDGDSLIYLDGTVGLLDFGFYPHSIQGRQTIVENGDNCTIGRVPELPATASTDSIDITVRLNADNTLTGTFSESLTGEYKASLLNSLRETAPHERNRKINNYITSRRTSWTPSNPVLVNDAPGNGPATLTSDLTINRAIKQAGDKTYLTLDMAPWLAGSLFDTKDRRYPGWLSLRRHIITSIDIDLPETFTPASVPQPVSIDNEWLKASITYSYDAGQQRLNATLQLTVNKLLVPLEDIKEYNEDMRRLTNAANTAFTLNNTQQ